MGGIAPAFSPGRILICEAGPAWPENAAAGTIFPPSSAADVANGSGLAGCGFFMPSSMISSRPQNLKFYFVE